jgi:intracellular sulfur oxidation DsrE/DsrF family protein
MNKELNANPSRRRFLGTITTGAAALSMAGILSPLHKLHAETKKIEMENDSDPDAWFNKIKGKHRIVFDVTQPHDVLPFAWPKVFLLTNAATGTPEKDCSVVVVLRHDAIPYAFEDRLWHKYKFSEVFKANLQGPVFQAKDAATAASFRNPFWQPQKGDFKFPGIGEVQIGINELQASGVMFCVCQAAMTVYSNAVAAGMNMNPADVLKDWQAGLLPGIQQVPSGVWAVGRAQEHGCAYCFAG